MHLDDVPRAGALVQQVDVLRDDRPDEPAPLELGERHVRRVRLGLAEHGEARRVEAPDLLGVAPEGAERRVLARVELGPHPRGGAEVRDAALGGDARAGEDDAGLVLADEPRQLSRRRSSTAPSRPAAALGRGRRRPEDLDPEPVRVEDEERVVVLEVVVLLGREVDLGAERDSALVRLVDLLAALHLEGEVLDPDAVVVVAPPSAGRSPRFCSPKRR